MSRKHLENSLMQAQYRNIEGAASQVIDGDDALLAFIEAVGEGGGCGFVHQPQYFQTRDTSGVLRGLALRIVEIGGNSNDRMGHRAPQRRLGIELQLAQYMRRNLRRREHLLAELQLQNGIARGRDAKWKKLQFFLYIVNTSAHQTLDGIDGALRMGEKHVAGIGTGDHLASRALWLLRWARSRKEFGGRSAP